MSIKAANTENILQAAQIIKDGGLVSFPTETVYGLGANVYNSFGVAHIFAVKKRPTFNPLISHIADIDFMSEYAQTDSRAIALAKKFWPGPLTLLLNRKDNNPSIDLACAGLPSITVRMPNNPIALELIKQSQVPIVAPSANISQSISPTTAQHVYDDFGEKIDMILDGGPCSVGVESTILDLTSKQIRLLRAGGLAIEEIQAFLGEKILTSEDIPAKITAPGQMSKHYAPKKATRINVTTPQEDEFFIGFGNMECQLNLSKTQDLHEAAGNLFAYLRTANEDANTSKIAIAPIPNIGLGLAINDRIIRASKKE